MVVTVVVGAWVVTVVVGAWVVTVVVGARVVAVVVGDSVVLVEEPSGVVLVVSGSDISPRKPTPTESKASDVSPPSTATPPRATAAMSTTTIAYSTRDAPRSDSNCLMKFVHTRFRVQEMSTFVRGSSTEREARTMGRMTYSIRGSPLDSLEFRPLWLEWGLGIGAAA